MHGVVHLAKLYTIIYNVSVVIIVHDVLKVALVASHRVGYSSFLHFGAHECVHYP